MPIYEYRCTSCGFQKEHLQKLSDALLTACPTCGADSYTKLLSAAGFQLKGSGWYATDFKGSGSPPASAKPAETSTSTTEAAPAATSTASGCGGGCACHPS